MNKDKFYWEMIKAEIDYNNLHQAKEKNDYLPLIILVMFLSITVLALVIAK